MSIQQKTRLATGDVQSQQSSWSKMFPSKLETESNSAQFVKKLLAVAVSNITYLRSMFPEDAYANKSLDKLPLKILKQNNVCEDAGTLASWLIGAFDAIENKYLKELMLIVSQDPDVPDEVHEMYTFRFSYPSGLATFEVGLQGGDGRNITLETTQKSTQSLLRRVLVLTQGLTPLPASAHVSMKLTYFDEVTPTDYEPTGFVPTKLVMPRLPVGVQSLDSGEVTTSHHTVGLRVQTVSCEVGSNTENPTVVSQQESQPGEERRMEVVQSSQVSQPRSQDMEAESASLLDPSLTVSCTCGNKNPDLLMLVCRFCSRAQHAACYRILEEAKLPVKHCCVQCSQEEEGRVCTDPKLVKMSAKPAMALTCLYRRVLAVLNVTQQISLLSLTEHLGITEEFAEQFIDRLLTENILTPTTGHLFDVNRQVLQQQALRKYLGIKYVEDSMVQQTDEMSIAAPVHDEVPGAARDIAAPVYDEVPGAAGDIAAPVHDEDRVLTAGGRGEGRRRKRVSAKSPLRKGDGRSKRTKTSATISGLQV
jgi:meiosis-specific protein HOP1